MRRNLVYVKYSYIRYEVYCILCLSLKYIPKCKIYYLVYFTEYMKCYLYLHLSLSLSLLPACFTHVHQRYDTITPIIIDTAPRPPPIHLCLLCVFVVLVLCDICEGASIFLEGNPRKHGPPGRQVQDYAASELPLYTATLYIQNLAVRPYVNNLLGLFCFARWARLLVGGIC